jgi:hypothetical protein
MYSIKEIIEASGIFSYEHYGISSLEFACVHKVGN